MRRHSLTGLSHSNNSTCAGKLWSWRIQRWVKRRRLTFWNWSHRVWKSRVDTIKCFFVNFFADFKLNFWSTAALTVMRSVALGQISTFGPPFDAPGSEVSSAAQIKEMRHFWKSVRRFFWKLEQNKSTNCRSTDCTGVIWTNLPDPTTTADPTTGSAAASNCRCNFVSNRSTPSSSPTTDSTQSNKRPFKLQPMTNHRYFNDTTPTTVQLPLAHLFFESFLIGFSATNEAFMFALKYKEFLWKIFVACFTFKLCFVRGRRLRKPLVQNKTLRVPNFGLYVINLPPEPRNNPYSDILWTHFAQIQKKWLRGFQTCRRILIGSALKSCDPGASSGGRNLEIRSLKADLVNFEQNHQRKEQNWIVRIRN